MMIDHPWKPLKLHNTKISGYTVLYSGSELFHIPTYIPVELQIKCEHSNINLEYLNKLSGLIAVQHFYVGLLSVLTTRYSIPYEYLIVQHHICSTRIPFEPPTSR